MGPAAPPGLTAPPTAHGLPERRAHAHQRPPRERFAPLWLRTSLVLATVVTLALLYPRSYIEANLRRQSHPSATTLAYLRLMMSAQPSAREVRLLLAGQALEAGDLALSRAALAPWSARAIPALPLDVARLRLRLLRAELDATRDSSPRHAQAAEDYVRGVVLLAPRLHGAELLTDARRVAALGAYRTTARLYRRIIAGAPDAAALRLEAFEGGVSALLAAGRPAEALAFAQRELAFVPRSTALWREMTRLALMADDPKLAARYARRLIGRQAP